MKRPLQIIVVIIILVIGMSCLPVLYSFAQAQSITLSETNASLKDLFREIKRQTGYEFVADSKTLAASLPVTIEVKNASMEQVLAICFKGQPMTYTISGNTIVVKPLEKSESKIPETKSSGLHYVEGRVTDKTGPVPGVNVVIRGTSEGTVTDAEGKYTLQANNNDLLGFSFIGFKRFETEVGERTIIDVTLEEEVAALNAVTINGGYYETTDELKTGSIVKVTSKDIEKQPVTSPLMALQGRVAGLEITPANGAPGVAPTIRIRGTNSLRIAGKTADYETTGNYPLYVIDGVPVNSVPITSSGGGYTGQGYDPLSTLSPSIIESIEVLKDGDATAIYGSRGANGVILITTKKTQKSLDKTNVDITAYQGIGTITKRLNLLNTEQYLRMRKDALANDGLTAASSDADLTLWDQSRYTDWQKTLLGGTANISDVQGSISSGNKFTSFRAGGGFHRETLVFPGDFGYKRITGQVSLNHRSLNNKFVLSVAVNYGLDNNRLFNDANGLLQAALTLPPNAPTLYNSDGSLNWEPFLNGGKPSSSWTNPLSSQKNVQQATTHNLISSANLSYEIFRGMNISVSGGYTDLSNTEKGVYPGNARPPESTGPGSANFSSTSRNSWIVEPKISFSRKSGSHSFSVLVGSTWQRSNTSVESLRGTNYPSDALLGSIKGAGLVTVARDDFFDYKYTSLYARLGYNWNERYILNVTARRDGSSRFGPGNRFGNFGAIGGGWIFSNENFFQGTKRILNFGKLRASYGTTGSDQVGDYRYYDLYDLSPERLNGVIGFTQRSLLNRNYAWEVTNKLETAIELGLFENRIGIEVNWYQNRSSNQLVDYTLPAITGFPSVLRNFSATVQNTGWEGLIKGELLSSNSLRWNVAINVTIPRNMLVKFDGLENSPYATIFQLGAPLSVQLLYAYKGINQTTGRYEFVDQNNDGKISVLDKKLQNPNDRAFYGGITNTIQYKSFDISFLLQFSKQSIQRYFPVLAPGRMVNQTTEALASWQNTGDRAIVQKLSTSAESLISSLNLMESNYGFVDATFIRLKTLSIAYRLPQKFLEKTKLQEGKIFLQGQNLYTVTGYSGLDPETGNGLPPLRMITLGLQLKI